MASWTKERTMKFIELYRSHECLWRVKNKDYSNKMKKQRCYEDLINFIKTFYPDANKDTVVSKISNLRGSWRKENKKMISSQMSGANADDIYEPGLFYFEALSFISESENARKVQEFDKSFAEMINSHEQEKDDDSQEQFCDSVESDVDAQVEQLSEESSSIASPRATPQQLFKSRELSSQSRQPPAKRKAPEDELLMLACEKLKTPLTQTIPKDGLDSFVQSVAHDLRSMTKEQIIHAKKLISDVIYEGQLETLSRQSRIVTAVNGFIVEKTDPDN